LKSKAYGDAPLNVNEAVWKAVLDREKIGEKEVDLDLVEDETDEEEEEDEMEEEDEREFVSDVSDSEDDIEDLVRIRSPCALESSNLT
jgi:protein MAK16